MKLTTFSAYTLSLLLSTVSALIDATCPDPSIKTNDGKVAVSGTVKLPTYYEKYVKHSSGIVITASDKYTNDATHKYALINALYTVNSMCSGEKTAKLCSYLGSAGIVIVLMDGSQSALDFPEADHYDAYKAVFMWANSIRPYKAIYVDGPSVAKAPNGVYLGENVLQHEFAHALNAAIDDLPEFKKISDKIISVYDVDLAERPDLFTGAYLRSNHYEMFAVASMIYHNSIRFAYSIDTRNKLRDQAKFMFDLMDSVYGGINFADFCVIGTNTKTSTSTSSSTSTKTSTTKTSTSTSSTSTKTSTSSSSSSTSSTATTTLIPTTTPDDIDDNGQISGASTVVPSWMLLIASVMALSQLL